MKIFGLFIGIDRYSSTEINELRCAKRDALALYSLFKDNYEEGNFQLIVDNDATTDNIENKFKLFYNCNEEDIIIFYFSGHGSNTHQIITYDSDPNLIDNTSISLKNLTEWLIKISSKNIFCFLDCCFSGGMGSKVLTLDIIPKDIESTEKLLELLSGEGRVIFTASKADQPAWENSKYGHGYFTYFLLEALKGAKEVVKAGKIPIYLLFEYVSKKVTDCVNRFGKQQNPTLKGKIEEQIIWPILKIGKNYKKNFPETIKIPVSSDINSLKNNGLPISILDIIKDKIPSLNNLQIEAINNYDVLEGKHLIVSAPTSSGKTMIGELAALKTILVMRDRSFFLFPLKALVNDKYRYFNNIYSSYGIRTIRATGESSDEIPKLMRGQYDLCLMTYEKFSSLILGNPFLLEQVGSIIVDEVQMITDVTRGANLEFILTLLRVKRNQNIEPQIILLSAVIGNTNGLENWLEGNLLRHQERPVPLNEGMITFDCRFKYVESDTQKEIEIKNYINKLYTGKNRDWVIPLVKKLVKEDKQVIVFRSTRSEAQFVAKYLSESLGLASANSTLKLLPIGDPSTTSQALKNVLKGGVAFHISDLDKDERMIIEEQFIKENSDIRVIVATTTLAMGINTPAEAVIVVGLNHPSNKGAIPYSIAEYKNIIGRAGRLGYSKRGESYLIASNQKEEYDFWKTYILGKPEDIFSRFIDKNTDIRTLIVKILVAGKIIGSKGMELNDIILFLEGSFGAYYQKYINHSWKWDRNNIYEGISSLENHNLIIKEKNIYTLTKLGWLSGQSGLEIESIVRIISIIRQLIPNEISDPVLITLSQITKELDSIFFPLNKKSVNKEPNAWIRELHNQNISQIALEALSRNITDSHQRTLRAKKAVAILLWITDTPMINIEQTLLQFGGGFNAAGQIRNVASRTCDILQIIFQISEIIHPTLNFGDRKEKLLSRIEIGIPSSIVDIGKRVGNRISRADYLSLIKNDILDVQKIENSTDDVLLNILNNDKEKLDVIRNAILNYNDKIKEEDFYKPILAQYKG